jgi:hypothetical protein
MLKVWNIVLIIMTVLTIFDVPYAVGDHQLGDAFGQSSLGPFFVAFWVSR